MDDRYDPNLILGYVEDELSAADRARVEAMLAEDEALAALVADLRRDRAALRSAPALEPKTDLAQGAIAALERQMLFDDHAAGPARHGATPYRFRLGAWLTYGGIAAVLALTVTVVFQSLRGEDGSPMGSVAMDDSAPHESDLARAPIEAQQRAAARRESAVALDEPVGAKPSRVAAAEPAGGELESPAASVAVVPPTASEPMATADAVVLRDRAAAPATAPAPAVDVTDAAGPEPVTLAESAELALAADDWDRLAGGGPGTEGQGDRAFEAMKQRGNAETPTDARELSPAGKPMSRFADSADPPPRYTLYVATPSAERVRRQLDAWAAPHHFAVIDHAADDASPRDGHRRQEHEAPSESADETDAFAEATRADADDDSAFPTRQRVILLVDERQVDALIRALSPDQTARVQLVDRLATNQREAGGRVEPMFTDWSNWRALPRLVEVEVVIDESPDALPPAPLRRDAQP